MLKIAVYPADEGGCGFYRMVQPLAAVKRHLDAVLDVCDGSELEPIGFQWLSDRFDWDVPVELVFRPDVDVMVFQRPLHAKWKHVFRLLREDGITVVVDLDDNFDCVDTGNIAYMNAEPHWLPIGEVAELRAKHERVVSTKSNGLGTFKYVPAHEGQSHPTSAGDGCRAACGFAVNF